MESLLKRFLHVMYQGIDAVHLTFIGTEQQN